MKKKHKTDKQETSNINIHPPEHRATNLLYLQSQLQANNQQTTLTKSTF